MHAAAITNDTVRIPLRTLVLAAAGYLLLYGSWIALGPRSEAERMLLGNLAAIFPAVTAVAAGLLAKQAAAQMRQRRAWLLLTSGLVAWALAGLARMAAGITGADGSLSASITDSFSLAGYLLILAGLLVYPHVIRRDYSRLRLFGEIAIATIGTVTLAWLALVRPLLTTPPADLPTSIFLAFPSVVAGLLLLIVLMNLFLLTKPGTGSSTMLWIGCGLVVCAAADLTASYLRLPAGGAAGGWIDLVTAAGLLAVTVGGFIGRVPANEVEAAFTARLIKFSLSLERALQSILPLLTTLALGIFSLLQWQVQDSNRAGAWITLVLVIILVARQGLVTGEFELQRYAVMVNSIAEPAFVCDSHGRMRLVNPAMRAALGLSSDLSAPATNLLDLVALEYRANDLLAAAVESGWSGEVMLRRLDGTRVPVYLSLRPMQVERRERITLAGTAHLLTEQKQQEAALRAALEEADAAHRELEALTTRLGQMVDEKTRSLSDAYAQLEEQNRTLQRLDEIKSDFVSMVSHELRAPLTNISGGIELVQFSAQLPEHVKQSLNLVQAEVRRLGQFVETILDLSSLEAGRMPFAPAPLDLIAFTETLKRQVSPMRGAERLTWHIPTKMPLIMADERALTSIFFHLIDNAIKYAPLGEIRIAAHCNKGQVFISVADQGPGVPTKALPLLFEKFYRPHHGDSQTVYGHGLGLYIVRRLLRAMNGDIKVENLPEKGACFTFWLTAIEEKDEYETTAGR